jgi:AcrR family transcriptional regulator
MARPRSESARQAALDAAFEVIADFGVGGFTVDAVAKRSGVAKTTIYRHWESGNQLLLDAIGCVVEPFPTPNTGSLRDDLIAHYTRVLPFMEDPGNVRLMLGILARSAADENFRSLKNEFAQERHNPIRTCLELAQARGELREDLDLDLAFDVIEGPFATKRLMRGEPILPEQIPIYVDYVLYGLKGPSTCKDELS